MAVPANFPISMQDIYNEFGGQGQPLTAFVRGGAYVPNVAQNNNVPTAPPISLYDLRGAVKTLPLQVSHSPNPINSAFVNEPAPATRSMNCGTTITATGGIEPYNYAWSFVSGDAMTNNSSGRIGSWNATVHKNGSRGARYRCTVTDQSGQSVAHDVYPSMEYSTNL